MTLSVWTEKGSPTLADRRKKYAGVSPKSRRPVNPAFIRSIFTRDHPGTAYADVVRSYADAICALDDSIPNGTYIDMCERLPLVDPKKITVPVMLTRGQYDGIAHASLLEKNHLITYYLIERFFSQPEPIYRA